MRIRSLKIVVIGMVLLTPVTSPKAQDTKSQNPDLYVQTMHTDKVATVTISPDGRWLASAGLDGTAKLWDVAGGRELRTWSAFSRSQSLLKFSPDGRLLAISRGDNKILIFNVNDERQVEITTTEGTNEILFTPDSKLIMSVGGFSLRDERKVWSVTDGRRVLLKDRFGLYPLYACSSDGRTLITKGVGGKGYKVWDGVGLKELTQFRRLNIQGRLRISPDGRFLAGEIEGAARRIKVWDIRKARLIFQKTCDYDCHIDFTPDSKYLLFYDYLLSVSDKKEAKLLNLSSGVETSLKQMLNLDQKELKDETIKEAYDSIASDPRLFELWYLDRMAGPTLKEVEKRKDSLHSFRPIIVYEPSQNLLAVSCEFCEAVKVVDMATKNEAMIELRRPTRDSLTEQVKTMSFVPGTGILVITDAVMDSMDKSRAMVWKVERERAAVSAKALNDGLFLTGFSTEVFSPAVSPNNKYIACFTDQNIYVWELQPLTRIWELNHIKWLTLGPSPELWYSPDSKILVIRVWSGILLLDIMDGSELSLEGHDSTKSFAHIAFSPDGRFLAGVEKERMSMEDEIYAPIHATDERSEKGEAIRVWDIASGKELWHTRTHTTSVDSVAFSEDGKVLADRSMRLGDNLIELWEAEGGKFIKSVSANDLPASQEVASRIPNLSEHIDGNDANGVSRSFAVTRAGNGKIRLINTATKAEVASLKIFGDHIAGGWVVWVPEGFFDTNFDLEYASGFHWQFPNEQLKPYPLEIFMRDYYVPRLLPRVLEGSKPSDQPPVGELNRIQPKVGKITVVPRVGEPDLVDVTVEISSVVGRCPGGDGRAQCESGVYDLRLYRDRQLIKQSPSPGASRIDSGGGNWREQLQQWRESNVVKTADGHPVTAASGAQAVTFKGIRLPQRAGISQVEFTAYAFNGDRVKSATSTPVIYRLPQHKTGASRRAYLIMVGIDATSDPTLRLPFAPVGAREAERLLRTELETRYKVVSVQLISEYKKGSDELQQDLATKKNIRTVLSLLSDEGATEAQGQAFKELSSATPDDLVVLYIASHGYADPNGKFYVVPSDVGDPAGVSDELLDRCLKKPEQSASCQDTQDFMHHSISSDELTQWLQTIDAGQMVLILDSCHSGAVSGPDFRPGPMGDRGFGQLSYDKGMMVLAATQAENLAWGGLEFGDRSLLTDALIHQGSRDTKVPFDLRRWLVRAEKLVPELYRKYMPPGAKQEQEPRLFDFARWRTDINSN